MIRIVWPSLEEHGREDCPRFPFRNPGSFPPRTSSLQSTSEIGDDRVDGERGERRRAPSKFEDVSPSIKLPWTRERRPSLPLVARL